MAANLSRVKIGRVPKVKPKKPYHHGDLRRALLDAAWSVTEREGLRALTLREVARSVGVTHAAPYHHFRDRAALLDAMSVEAFEALDRAMQEAEEGVDDPAERLFVLGRAYIDFACAHPERVEVMFRRRDAADVEPSGASTRAFQHLVDAIVACQEAGVAPPGDPMELAVSAWSVVHGFSSLVTEGPLGQARHQGRFEPLRDGLLRRHGAALRAMARLEP
jgi:AcrR family transcriptional regulator